MRRLVIVAVVIAALGLLFLYGLRRGSPDRIITSNMLGQPVPAIELPVHSNLLTQYGSTFSLPADAGGRPVIINFWAEWCEPCRVEAPLLQDIWEAYGDDVLVLGVQTLDRGRQAAGRSFINEFGLTFPNVFDGDSRSGRAYGLFGVPETFFVNSDGTLHEKHAGILTADLLERKVGELLN